jgi:hypothetical protein
MRLARIAEGKHAAKIAKIRSMTREEKYAELNAYYQSVGVLNLDIDQIKKDQVLLGAPDSALDEALIICAALSGAIFGRGAMTAQELSEELRTGPVVRKNIGGISGPPPFSLRKSGKIKQLDK